MMAGVPVLQDHTELLQRSIKRSETMTLKQAGELMGLSPSGISDLIRKHKSFPCHKVGIRYVVRRSDLDKWMDTEDGKDFKQKHRFRGRDSVYEEGVV